MENKESFKNRIAPFFGTYDLLDLQLAYYLSKYGHRGNLRQELNEEGKPLRYFEHVRRVSLILMDEMQIMDRNMIISALLHDSIEDCPDLPPELLEHIYRDWETDRKSTRLNSSHSAKSRMPSSA